MCKRMKVKLALKLIGDKLSFDTVCILTSLACVISCSEGEWVHLVSIQLFQPKVGTFVTSYWFSYQQTPFGKSTLDGKEKVLSFLK